MRSGCAQLLPFAASPDKHNADYCIVRRLSAIKMGREHEETLVEIFPKASDPLLNRLLCNFPELEKNIKNLLDSGLHHFPVLENDVGPLFDTFTEFSRTGKVGKHPVRHFGQDFQNWRK